MTKRRRPKQRMVPTETAGVQRVSWDCPTCTERCNEATQTHFLTCPCPGHIARRIGEYILQSPTP